ncbi:MAG: adenylate/guanylate cyclase domain-containing protein [Armatimonadota bacterium]|nr:adenylate/guanylate cyclase domain-containing protein [Armatimonadota bacterium]
MIRCPQCGTENPAGAKFCMRCGTALMRRCANCGAENPLDAHFCLRCGRPLEVTAAAERRIVTVLFADLVGSTPMVVRLDPEKMRAIIADYFADMRGEVERHSGVVEKFIGDSVMAVFGVPAAHEDDPERAVRAALAMRERMKTLNARLQADLRIRIGIATGEVITDTAAVDGGQFMATGEAVNLAARLQQHAAPDAIVIDERTQRAVRRVAEARPLPAPGDGDFADRARWEVLGLAARSKSKRLRAPMLGREGELQFLQALYRRVVDGRRPHVITVIGPAGVGKSRLADEFLATLGTPPDGPQVLRGRCPAYGEGLTYWPIIEMLKQECGIKDTDASSLVHEKLRAGVARVCSPRLPVEDCEAIVAGLAPVLGLSVHGTDDVWSQRLQALRRTVESRSGAKENLATPTGPELSEGSLARALRMLLAAKAASGPVVLVIEDLHWAEQSLLDLIEYLAVRGGDGPMLTLCLARPELLERYPQWGGRVRNYTAVSLSPLPEALGDRLITDLLTDQAVPADVRLAILERAEGNPFFIQEILRMLIDGGGLVRTDDGWRWASYPQEIRIPDTINGILASRLDLLSALEKRVVQDAALIGRRFWLSALLATGGLHAAEVSAALERLQEREVIEERQAPALGGEREFTFTHALIREVAYSTLPKAQRSTKHLRFARWLEQTAARDDEEYLELLAYHYEQAWRYTFETGERDEALARTAIDVLRKAGARAGRLRTLPEALRLYDRALAVLRNAGLTDDIPLLLQVLTDRCEVAKWMSLADILFEDTEIVLRLAPTIGRDDLVARAWLNRAFAEYTKGRLEPAEQAIARALDAFRQQHDVRGRAEAHEVLGFVTEDLRGKLTKAHAAYREALEYYRTMHDGQGMARVMARLGRALLDNGRLEESRGVLTEALGLAVDHHELLSHAYASTGLGVLAHLTGDDAEAVRRLEEAIRIRHELGNPLSEAYTRHRLGMHYLRVGRLDDAEREFRTARALRLEHGAKSDSALLLRGLAEVYLARGDVLAAAEHAEQAIAALPETDIIALATHRATLGRIRAAQGRAEEAEALFTQSLETLERREYPIDLALALLRYGEALIMHGDTGRARVILGRARSLFEGMGATRFVHEVDARLGRTAAHAP